MYSQLLSTYHTWRWGPWISLIYNGITALGLLFTYFPHIHARAEGFSASAIIKRIDFMGGFLSITGLTIFLVALQAGGYTHPWASAYVLCPLIIGFFTIVAWVVWEWKIATHPMVPRELFQGQRVVALAYTVAFVAGMNFFSLLNFWPLLISTVYNTNPVHVGLRGFIPGLMTTVGAIFFNALLSTFPGGARWILLVASGILCAFGGALSVVTPDNELTTMALGSTGALGLGGVIVPAATVAMIAAPDALITTCAALSLSIRAVGGSIGYSIYFNIFSEKLKARLPLYVAEYAVKAGLPLQDAKQFVVTFLTAPEKITSVPGITPQVLAAALKGSQWAYAESLKYVW
jgi:Fungal trichothecene efflux pump (TRI12)